MRLLISAFCALAFCLVTTEVRADSISILNASFETTSPLGTSCAGAGCAFNFGPVPDWTITGATGSFQPGTSTNYFNTALPDGSIVAYTNGGTLSQTLAGISLLPNATYTLSVDVGRRNDVVAANYSLNLLDGSTVFCTSGPTSNASIAAGTFTDVTLTCTTGASVPAGLLGIELTGDGRQIDFDNVQLSVTGGTVATPEPGALLLTLAGLLMSGLLFLRSRRNLNLQVAA